MVDYDWLTAVILISDWLTLVILISDWLTQVILISDWLNLVILISDWLILVILISDWCRRWHLPGHSAEPVESNLRRVRDSYEYPVSGKFVNVNQQDKVF